MKEIKSNWSNLEANSNIGRVPKRGVRGFVSRNRQTVLVATVGTKAAKQVRKQEEMNRYSVATY